MKRQGKEFSREGIPEWSFTRKEIAVIDIFFDIKNGERKIVATYLNKELIPLKNKEWPILKFQMNIYKSNAYEKRLDWLNFRDDLGL